MRNSPEKSLYTEYRNEYVAFYPDQVFRERRRLARQPSFCIGGLCHKNDSNERRWPVSKCSFPAQYRVFGKTKL